jgi:magnesium transporter
MSGTAEREPAAAAGSEGAGPRVRCVFRSAAGEIDLDFPAGRIPEALAQVDATLWVDIHDPDGADRHEVARLLGEVFGFHPLAIEDAVEQSNAPKIDDWGAYLYLVFHAIRFDPETDAVCLHELDAFLGRHYLVTHHTEPMPIVESVRRLVARDADNRLRRRPDHLLYLLLDRGVAAHLEAVEHLDDAVDALTDRLLHDPRPDLLAEIFAIKRSVLRVFRIIVPQREVANRLSRDPYPQVGERDKVYFRDVYDGLVRLHDLVETVRDLITGCVDTYLSRASQRTNEIMKTLTLVTVLFLPLNFIVGFFGMNFFGDNIHLNTLWSDHGALFALGCGAMLGSVAGIWWWGHRRGWY